MPPLPLQLVKMPGTGSCVLLPPAVSGLKANTRKLLELVRVSQIPIGRSLATWAIEQGIPSSTAYRSQDELLAAQYVTKSESYWALTPVGEAAFSHVSQALP